MFVGSRERRYRLHGDIALHLYINVHDDPAKPKAPTLVDVAREARVSLKTASRVLNGSARVKEEVVNSVMS